MDKNRIFRDNTNPLKKDGQHKGGFVNQVSDERRAAIQSEFNELFRGYLIEKTESEEVQWKLKKEYGSYTVYSGFLPPAQRCEVVVFADGEVVLKFKRKTRSVGYDTREMGEAEELLRNLLRCFGRMVEKQVPFNEASIEKDRAKAALVEARRRATVLPPSPQLHS